MNMPSMKRSLHESFDSVLARIPEALSKEGFGVLTEIDVQATMKKKLDKDIRPYRILGACNPALAHRALGVDPEVGVLLPCNVVVYEQENGDTIVSIVDPNAAIGAFGPPALKEVASEVSAKLARVLESVA